MKEIFVKKVSTARDGGTTIYVDKDGKRYWKDWRIGSQSKGSVFDRYPSDDGAKILNFEVKLIEIPENLEFE